MKDILRPPDLRETDLPPWKVMDEYDPADTVRHRRAVIETSPAEKEVLAEMIDLSQLPVEFDLPAFETRFPSFRKALWVFERAPRSAQFVIQSITPVHREHHRVDYTLTRGDLPPQTRSVIFKDTSTARLERMMAQAAHLLGLPSYRVLSVDGRQKPGPSWVYQHIGVQWNQELGGNFPLERAMAIIPSQYGVIQFIPGDTCNEYYGQLDTLSPDKQRLFLHHFGAVKAADFIFGAVDAKLEHFIVDPNTMAITRIDREQSLALFKDQFMAGMSWLTPYHSSLPAAEQLAEFRQGVAEVLVAFEQRSTDLEELFRRSTNFGVAGKEISVVTERLFLIVSRQIEALREWLAHK